MPTTYDDDKATEQSYIQEASNARKMWVTVFRLSGFIIVLIVLYFILR